MEKKKISTSKVFGRNGKMKIRYHVSVDQFMRFIKKKLNYGRTVSDCKIHVRLSQNFSKNVNLQYKLFFLETQKKKNKKRRRRR